ncbi:MAG: IS630 transposase-related protein [Gammaproteobacteria bacterium]
MSYSEDFRTMVLSHLDAGETIEKVSQLFSVGTSSIKRWKRNRKVTGKVMGQGRPKNPYKIGDEDLKKYIKEHPDAYLNEIADYFGVTSPGVFATLKRLKITRKKDHFLQRKM